MKRFLKNRTVLVVEDDIEILNVLIEILEYLFKEVRGVGNGREALDMLEHYVPDVLLTDLTMPRMGGLELVSHLQESHPTIPIIMLTAHCEQELADQAIALGAAEVLYKPYATSNLFDSFGRVFAGKMKEDAHG